jgi:hypothetical protein
MKGAFRWLQTPLAGTAFVLAGIGVIAIPLHRLTSATKAQAPAATQAPVVTDDETLPAVLRLRLLDAAKRVVISDASGAVLWDLADAVPGETEHDVGIKLSGHELELGLRVEFADGENESAAFLTVMPDAHEEQTSYAIGRGQVEETLRYEWHAH